MEVTPPAESLRGVSGIGSVEEQRCPSCDCQLPSPRAGEVLICPHCHRMVEDGTSIFASDSSLTMTAVPPSLTTGVLSTSAGANSGNISSDSGVINIGAGGSASPDRPVVVDSPVTSRREGRFTSHVAWQLLLTYASLMTLAALFLGWQLWRRPTRDLLDLPDLAPPANKDGRVTTLIYVPAGKPLLRSHQLDLGESRRFGSVEISAVGVCRGPLKFEYFDPSLHRNDFDREPSGDVLQLHLRVKNVSSDQTFAPFDRNLVYTRETNPREEGHDKANNLIWDRADPSEIVLYLYDLSPDSDWVVAGQNLDRDLGPGESLDVFLPSTDPLPEELPEEMVWRFHFRKGYNRRSLRGVTTVAEICFSRQQISQAALATSWRIPGDGWTHQSPLCSLHGTGPNSSLPSSP